MSLHSVSPFSSRLVCFLLQGVPTAVARSVCPHPLGPRLPAAGEHVTAAVASAGGLPPDSAAFPFALPARALVGSQLRGIRTRLCGNRWGGGGAGGRASLLPPLPSPLPAANVLCLPVAPPRGQTLLLWVEVPQVYPEPRCVQLCPAWPADSTGGSSPEHSSAWVSFSQLTDAGPIWPLGEPESPVPLLCQQFLSCQ